MSPRPLPDGLIELIEVGSSKRGRQRNENPRVQQPTERRSPHDWTGQIISDASAVILPPVLASGEWKGKLRAQPRR